MKLYLLKAQEDLAYADDPWKPWYDKAFGFVVRATSRDEARQIADANAGKENFDHYEDLIEIKRHPWLDIKYSTCQELLIDDIRMA